ncbi:MULTISPECIES: hypothetical protein [unclassified Bifidobacterium]|uniref:hypothetical protein n=1 Tax=unclassified Bifidobacterium TaxID=2608897 RepID=UPI0023F63492|nr:MULTISPECIES: hypothetical protein [unclassified Bifidobacterium]WEV65868.1 hypothetical protein OZX71_00390 [Bifidobacterium sp. ESL0764]WEV75344.1 hypothetical protein OZX75_06865 [Bifidobacterium sp. ESL0800]
MNENNSNNPIEWLKRITHDDSINKISRLSGIPYTTLYKRYKSNALSTDEIIAIARGYQINPVEALVQNHVIDKEEATDVRGDNALRLTSINDIADEIVRRSTATSGPAGNDNPKKSGKAEENAVDTIN